MSNDKLNAIEKDLRVDSVFDITIEDCRWLKGFSMTAEMIQSKLRNDDSNQSMYTDVYARVCSMLLENHCDFSVNYTLEYFLYKFVVSTKKMRNHSDCFSNLLRKNSNLSPRFHHHRNPCFGHRNRSFHSAICHSKIIYFCR